MRDKFIILLLLIIIILSIGLSIFYIKYNKHKDILDNQENLEINNYANNKYLLDKFLEKDSILLRILADNNIKKSKVTDIIKITENNKFNIKDTTINDTLKCINFNQKGISIDGCNGVYELKINRTMYGVAYNIRQNKKGITKKGFFKFLYPKKTTVKCWTEFGDTLNIKMIEK